MNIAMRKIPNFYTEKEIAIIEAGEQTGMLKDTFIAIAGELRMQEELRSKVIGALTYPFIILVFLVLAVSVIMVYMIPQIMPVISEMAAEMSFWTSSLIAVSDFMREHIVWIIALIIALALIFRAYVVTDTGRMAWDKYKLYNVLTGKVYKNYIIVQVMATQYLLSSSGVSIVKALRLTGASAGNVFINQMYQTISLDVSRGKRLSEAMIDADKDHYIFTPDIIQLIESAEKTSTVHTTSKKIGEQYKRELDAALAMMVKFIEPIALLGAGLFVMWFAMAIFSVVMQITKSAGVM